jgi:hypothetical protein
MTNTDTVTRCRAYAERLRALLPKPRIRGRGVRLSIWPRSGTGWPRNGAKPPNSALMWAEPVVRPSVSPARAPGMRPLCTFSFC